MTQQEQYAIRDMYDAEADQLWRLFHATVRSVNLADYSAQQVAAWSPENRDMDQACKDGGDRTLCGVKWRSDCRLF